MAPAPPTDPAEPPRRFFLPGPAHVDRAVLERLTRPVVGHRSAPFRELYATLGPRLRQVFRTSGEVMIATSSATLLMESALRSAVRSEVLHLTNGAFSERWQAISRSIGCAADRLSVPWGKAVDPDLVRGALRRKRYEAVTVVHNETATGVTSPLAEIGAAVREESDALLLVDAVSSLGGAPLETDAWGLDLVLTGSQKALALPPGLALFTLSERLAERAAAVPERGFYTDLLRYREEHRAGGTITTPAVSLIYALDLQLDRILAEGIEARWRRHRELAERVLAWAAQHGFEAAAEAGHRSRTLTCLRPPAGIDAGALVRGLAERGFTVGSGYGEWRAATFRIGHMGDLRRADLDGLLAEIEAVVDEGEAG